MKKKLYIETSVWSQLEHDDRPDWYSTAWLFYESLKKGIYEPYISKIVIDEIAATPDANRRQKLFSHINMIEPISLEFDQQAQSLTACYMAAEFKNSTSRRVYNDSSHVAIATINEVRHVVSFNCHHLVNDRRIDGFNAVNLQEGYDLIVDISTPDRFISLSSEEVSL